MLQKLDFKNTKMYAQFTSFLLIIFSSVIITRCTKKDAHVCSVIKIPMCIEMPYNATRMPNLLRHRTQEEAAIMAHEFLPLVDIGCSPHVRFFICSVFAPMCTSKLSYGITSCRVVCLSVMESCLPVLTHLNFKWPSFLRCDLFPEDGLCMMPPNLKPHLGNPSLRYGATNLPNRISKPTLQRETLRPTVGDSNFFRKVTGFLSNTSWSLGSSTAHYTPQSACSGARTWVPNDEELGVCTPLCGEDFLFKAPEKKMAKAWMASWAFVCLASTSFSMLTFCFDPNRFKYPERPVICLALSYFFYSIPFIIPLITPFQKLSCETDPGTGHKHLAVAGTSSSGCVASFLLQYYFGLASELWWTILTFCWFMSSGRFWGSEGLSHFDTYFHMLAWGAPAIASVLVILFRQIDGDELTGLCYVGNLRPSSLLLFVIIPHGILVLLGTIFVIFGFFGLVKIRNIIRKQTVVCSAASSSLLSSSTINQERTRPSLFPPTSRTSVRVDVSKLERLMIRLGVYSTLSTIPAVLVLLFRLIFYFKYDSWVEEASSSCHESWTENDCIHSRSRTILSLLCIFMSLVVGVTSGIWVWSPKTFLVWRKALTRFYSFSLQRFKKSSNSNLSPQLVLMENVTTARHDATSNITLMESDVRTFLSPPGYELGNTDSTVRTSSRRELLRSSESSFV